MTNTIDCPHATDARPEPGDFIAALPHLVGYQPRNSLVAIFLDGSGELLLTARLDWPQVGAGCEALADLLCSLGQRNEARAVGLIAVGPTAAPADEERQMLTLVHELNPRREDEGRGTLTVLWAVHTQAGRWWTTTCHRSCGPRSHEVPEPATSALVIRMGQRGRTPRRDRGEILGEFQRAPIEAINEVQELRATLTEPDREALDEVERDSIAERTELLLMSDTVLTLADLATICACCCDVGARDLLLWRFAGFADADSHVWVRVWPRLLTALVLAPHADVAGVGSVAGLFAWQMGDGIRASAALNLALDHDSNHRLAGLLYRAIAAGLPPGAWQRSISALPESRIVAGSESRPGGTPGSASGGQEKAISGKRSPGALGECRDGRTAA